MIGGLSLLVTASTLVFGVSTTTEQRFRSLCPGQLQTSDGTVQSANVPCDPYMAEVATSWRAPVLLTTLGVISAIVILAFALVPRFTREPPDLNALSVVPLQGAHRRNGVVLHLQPVFTWVYRLISAGLIAGSIALFFARAPWAVPIVFATLGGLFLRMSGVASLRASPTGLRARMLLFGRRWAWDDITRIVATDGLTRRGYRVRYFVVETMSAKPFVRESLTSPPGRRTVSRVDRAIAAIEDYRASLGHVGISVLRDSGAR